MPLRHRLRVLESTTPIALRFTLVLHWMGWYHKSLQPLSFLRSLPKLRVSYCNARAQAPTQSRDGTQAARWGKNDWRTGAGASSEKKKKKQNQKEED